MSEWKEVRLGDVATLSTGFPFKGEKYSSKGIRVVRGDNVTIGELRWTSEKDKRWIEEFDRTEEFSLRTEDIVIGMDGSRVGYNRAQIKSSDLPLLLAQRVACIRNNTLSYQSFLYYQIFSKQFTKYIRNIQTGSAIPHVSLTQIGDFSFLLPPLETQQKIASILSSLDDKIAVNRRICENLEAQAQALFKHWFIDFTPFKDGKFVESELGMIPEGWRVMPIDDVFKISYGKNLPATKIMQKGDYPVYGANGVMGYYSDYNYDNYVTLITSRGSGSGDVSRTFYEKTFVTNNSFAVTPREQYSYLSNGYAFYFIKNINFKPYCSGSAQPQLTNASISAISIILPDKEIIEKYNVVASMIFDELNRIHQESSRLATLRDTLLPKLMSGEIKV